MKIDAKSLCKRFEALNSDRASWNQLYADIATYFMPRRIDGFVGKSTQPDREAEKVLDNTGQKALRTLAAALAGMSAPMSSQWFKLTTGNNELDRRDDVAEWLEQVTRDMDSVFRHPPARFYSSYHESMASLAAFGTASMFIADEGDGVRFEARHLAETLFAENEKGQIDTVFRKFELTAIQAWNIWGDKCGPNARKAMERNSPDEKIEHIHVVMPAPPGESVMGKPFIDVYIERESRTELARGGFFEFPFAVGRFETQAGSIYGFSPTMTGLADCKTLQAMWRDTLRAAAKNVNPPMAVSEFGNNSQIDLRPGAVNRVQVNGQTKPIEPIHIPGDIRLGMEMIDQKQGDVRAALLNDVIMSGEQAAMTATEVWARTEERARVLGPVAGRIMSEFLGPIIDRTFAIMQRRGQIPPAPDVLQGSEVKPIYTSPLAQMMRAPNVQATSNWLAIVGQVAQFDQGILHSVDTANIPGELARDMGVSPLFVRSDEEVAQIKQQAAQAQQEMQQIDAAGQAAQAFNAAAGGAKSIAEIQNMGAPQ